MPDSDHVTFVGDSSFAFPGPDGRMIHEVASAMITITAANNKNNFLILGFVLIIKVSKIYSTSEGYIPIYELIYNLTLRNEKTKGSVNCFQPR